MKVFIAYKHTGEDPDKLKKNLEIISNIFTAIGYDTFIFFRDIQDWGKVTTPPEQVMSIALKKQQDCSHVFAYINNFEISEGLSLEVGYAKALNKKLIIGISKSLPQDSHMLLLGLGADIIKFKNLKDLCTQIPKFFEQIER